jgi:hypothetical protein
MVGTVTISLEDFKALELAARSTAQEKELLKKTAKEIEVFLSYLTTKLKLEEHIEEFNKYSSNCSILVINGKVKIDLKDIDK